MQPGRKEQRAHEHETSKNKMVSFTRSYIYSENKKPTNILVEGELAGPHSKRWTNYDQLETAGCHDIYTEPATSRYFRSFPLHTTHCRQLKGRSEWGKYEYAVKTTHPSSLTELIRQTKRPAQKQKNVSCISHLYWEIITHSVWSGISWASSRHKQ